MATIPWRENAVLTKDQPGDYRSIEMEGSLAAVACFLATSATQYDNFRVALPDRMVAPREWNGDSIKDLVRAYRAYEKKVAAE